MKRRRLCIFVLLFVYLAFYLYYTIQTLLTIRHETKENSSDFKKKDVFFAHQKEEEIKDVKQKNREKQNRLMKIWRKSIHLAVVVCGERANESLILLKSALIFTTSFIIVHIFAEEELHMNLKIQLDAWQEHITGKFEYRLHGISYPERANPAVWKKMYRPCATQRLFLPLLLPSVDLLLYIDADAIFLSPLEEIWSHFTKFNSSQLAALAPEDEDKEKSWYTRFARHPYYGLLGVNSGVMLMNLTRMRKSTWTESMVVLYRKYKQRIWWGDQDLINIYFHFHPDQLYVYNCEWNFRVDHCLCTNVCKGADRHGAYVLHGSRRVMHGDKYPAFKAVYTGFQEFDLITDKKQHILKILKRNLERTNSTPCGKVSHIFTKRIEYYIEKDFL